MYRNEQEDYITYRSSLTSIRNILGIGDLDIYLRPELSPYITRILAYLNSKLVLLGPDQELKTYIQEVFDTFSDGANRIVYGDALGLAIEIGVDVNEEWVEDDKIPYNQDRFVFSWTNIMTTIYHILKLSYSGLFEQETETCPCECGGTRVNITGKDTDEWTSGIYPEDENYDYISKDNTIKVGWNVNGSYIDQCTKCNRKS